MLVEFIECELTHDKMRERAKCFINAKYVTYIEEDDFFKGYCYIGFVAGNPTLVKGTLNEVKEKLEGKKWLKILHRQ